MVYRALLVVGLSAGALAGCKNRCSAEITLNEDNAHSAALTWSARTEGTVTFSYSGDGDATDRLGAVDSSGAKHTAVVWGLPPLAEIQYQFDSDSESCVDTFTASGMPSGLPTFSVPSYDEADIGSWRYLAGIAMGEAGTLFVIDRDGRWRYHQAHDRALNVSTVTVDGGTLIHNSFDQDRTNDIGQVHFIDIITGDTVSTRTEGAHHTFAHLPDGSIAFPSVDVRPWTDPDSGEEYRVVGDRILEIAPDGTVAELWSSWDHAEPTIHDAWDSGFYGDLGQDWTHANALNYSEERDSYLLSLGHLDTIYEIDRSTGAVLLHITPEDVATGEVYNFQHDTNWSSDGTLLLLSYPEDKPAIAIEYAVSSEGVLEEVWSYQRDKMGSTLLGQARRLPNGNTFINFGGIGEMREVTPSGDIAWQLNIGLGAWFGNVALLDTLPVLP